MIDTVYSFDDVISHVEKYTKRAVEDLRDIKDCKGDFREVRGLIHAAHENSLHLTERLAHAAELANDLAEQGD